MKNYNIVIDTPYSIPNLVSYLRRELTMIEIEKFTEAWFDGIVVKDLFDYFGEAELEKLVVEKLDLEEMAIEYLTTDQIKYLAERKGLRCFNED